MTPDLTHSPHGPARRDAAPAATGSGRGTGSPPALELRGVTVDYGNGSVVHDVDLALDADRITVLVGANGCGKSTLLKCLARQLKPQEGSVHVHGEDVSAWPRRRMARQVGFLPQDPVAPEGVSVLDLVSRGRHPHRGPLGRWTREDDAAVAEALDLTGLVESRDRLVTDLSGGQRQRVWIALALAQRTGILLLDEPTTYLDIAHQVEVLDVLSRLQRARRMTVVMVLHELSMAARYADVLVAMSRGRVVARGAVAVVFTEEMVREVFGMESKVLHDVEHDAHVVLPLSRVREGGGPSDG